MNVTIPERPWFTSREVVLMIMSSLVSTIISVVGTGLIYYSQYEVRMSVMERHLEEVLISNRHLSYTIQSLREQIERHTIRDSHRFIPPLSVDPNPNLLPYEPQSY